MSATIAPRPVTLKKNVTLTFRSLQVTKQNVQKTKDHSSFGLVVKVVVVVVVVVFLSLLQLLLFLRLFHFCVYVFQFLFVFRMQL